MPGGGDVEYLENYSFLVAVEGVEIPCPHPVPILRVEADGGTVIWGVGGKGVRVCTCGVIQRAGTPGTFTGQPSRAGRWRDFLAVAVFVFWVLRDSVLAPSGCYPSSQNFILCFPWCKLCKMTVAGRRVADVRLHIPKVLAVCEGKTCSPKPRVPTCKTREERRALYGAGRRSGAGRGGMGAKGRSL